MGMIEAMGAGRRVCVIVAHPDDEALICGGAIRRLADQGAAVSVLAVTDGGQGRGQRLAAACALLGATGRALDFTAGRLMLDMDLIAAIDAELRETQPELVLTHAAARAQHQDHSAIRSAVERSLRRWHEPVLALGGEPPDGACGWAPTVFTDISAAFEAKVAAVEVYAGSDPRHYLTRETVEARAAYWGLMGSAGPARLVEPFDLLLWQ